MRALPHFLMLMSISCFAVSAGRAYVETDPAEADATTVIQNLLYGRYTWRRWTEWRNNSAPPPVHNS